MQRTRLKKHPLEAQTSARTKASTRANLASGPFLTAPALAGHEGNVAGVRTDVHDVPCMG